MEDRELIKVLEAEYWGMLAAGYQDNHAPRILDTEDAPTFYQYLLGRGLTAEMLADNDIEDV